MNKDNQKDIKMIRYTIAIPSEYIEEMKGLTEDRRIPSVNYGVREALAEYLDKTKKEIYDAKLEEAAKDKAFIKRTTDTVKDFIYVDSEVGGEW
ncbi:MAG: hypothetical protein PHG48_06725 [Eubacteriales bacterium]|nr:hypothetical protein [Eubacteriales bacterium]